MLAHRPSRCLPLQISALGISGLDELGQSSYFCCLLVPILLVVTVYESLREWYLGLEKGFD
jgi:hypothetical protein